MSGKVIYLKDVKTARYKRKKILQKAKGNFIFIFKSLGYTLLGLFTIVGFFSTLLLIFGKDDNGESIFINHFNYLVNTQGFYPSLLLILLVCFFSYEIGKTIKRGKLI